MNTTAIKKAQETQRLQRMLGIAPERLNPLEKAKTNPKSRSLAIRAKCYDCVGQDADPAWHRRVRECEFTECPLWEFRPQ